MGKRVRPRRAVERAGVKRRRRPWFGGGYSTRTAAYVKNFRRRVVGHFQFESIEISNLISVSIGGESLPLAVCRTLKPGDELITRKGVRLCANTHGQNLNPCSTFMWRRGETFRGGGRFRGAKALARAPSPPSAPSARFPCRALSPCGRQRSRCFPGR